MNKISKFSLLGIVYLILLIRYKNQSEFGREYFGG